MDKDLDLSSKQSVGEITLEPAPTGEKVRPLRAVIADKSRSQRYRSLGEVARGGMGAILRVWDSELRRHLAMKVVLPKDRRRAEAADGQNDERLERFLEEAQITGQLNHPGIVPVHEVGLDSTGRVFFTMRLVRGRDLEAIFDCVKEGRDGWTLTRALTVLLKVCEAVAYAHSKGVIHRDLKPANIMVGRFGEVYVMDWGVAKVLGRESKRDLRPRQPDASMSDISTTRSTRQGTGPDEPIVTMDGTVLGTASFMSPEQARGEIRCVDRRSDVYSLGAILYQLLTGRAPYVPEGSSARPYYILMLVLEGSPRPCHELNPSVPAELAAICEKAMRRNPAGRYADPLEMAADLSAFLEGRVVEAHRTGAFIEARKWIARNKLAAAFAVSILVLVSALTVAGWFFKRSQHSAEVADVAGAVGGFFSNDLLAAAFGGGPGRGQNLRVEALLDDASSRIDGQFDSMPEAEAPIRLSLGRCYLSIGRYPLAGPHLERALELFETLHGPRDARTLGVLDHLGQLRLLEGRFEEAEDLTRECWETCQDELGIDHPDTLNALSHLAEALLSLGRVDDAEACLARGYELSGKALGEDSAITLSFMNFLGVLHLRQHRFKEAERVLTDSLEAHRRVLGKDDPASLTALSNLATVHFSQDDFERAEELFTLCVQGRKERLGEAHPQTLQSTRRLVRTYLAESRFQEAVSLLTECLEIQRRELGDEHLDTLDSADLLARVYTTLGQLTEAAALASESLEMRRRVQGESNVDTLKAMATLARIRQEQHRYADAETLFTTALEGSARILGSAHETTQTHLRELVSLYETASNDRSLEREPAVLAGYLERLAEAYVEQGRFAEAQASIERSLELARAADGEGNSFRGLLILARAAAGQDRVEEAEALYLEALAGVALASGEGSRDHLAALEAVVLFYEERSMFAEAIPFANELCAKSEPENEGAEACRQRLDRLRTAAAE